MGLLAHTHRKRKRESEREGWKGGTHIQKEAEIAKDADMATHKTS